MRVNFFFFYSLCVNVTQSCDKTSSELPELAVFLKSLQLKTATIALKLLVVFS